MSAPRRLAPDPATELAHRRRQAIEADAAFLARLLACYPERATLARLGLRPIDYAYRAKLGLEVTRAARP